MAMALLMYLITTVWLKHSSCKTAKPQPLSSQWIKAQVTHGGAHKLRERAVQPQAFTLLAKMLSYGIVTVRAMQLLVVCGRMLYAVV